MSLPTAFCWTRFGVESGEDVDKIFARKNNERELNGGLFLWGIGNSLGPSMDALETVETPQVLFSPIDSAPKPCDVAPEELLAWTSAETFDGRKFELPKASLVTSRNSELKRHHYALVCTADTPLEPTADFGTIYFKSLTNLKTGNPVGNSQVTCVVKSSGKADGKPYRVALKARLAAPYFIRLSDPILVPRTLQDELADDTLRKTAIEKITRLSRGECRSRPSQLHFELHP